MQSYVLTEYKATSIKQPFVTRVTVAPSLCAFSKLLLSSTQTCRILIWHHNGLALRILRPAVSHPSEYRDHWIRSFSSIGSYSQWTFFSPEETTVCPGAHCARLWYTPLVEVNQAVNSLVVLDKERRRVCIEWPIWVRHVLWQPVHTRISKLVQGTFSKCNNLVGKGS